MFTRVFGIFQCEQSRVEPRLVLTRVEPRLVLTRVSLCRVQIAVAVSVLCIFENESQDFIDLLSNFPQRSPRFLAEYESTEKMVYFLYSG